VAMLQGATRLLINFWGHLVAPCRSETPWLIELRNQYAAQGFEVLGNLPRTTSTAATHRS